MSADQAEAQLQEDDMAVAAAIVDSVEARHRLDQVVQAAGLNDDDVSVYGTSGKPAQVAEHSQSW